CPTFMIRREVLADVGPFNAERWDIAADQEMWLRLMRRYPVGILNERLLRYRHTPQQWTHRWRYLRIEPDRAIEVMEECLRFDDWRTRLPPRDLLELEYQRADDATTRAANALILARPALARELLAGQYPYAALFHNFRRRKLRVLLLRGLMKLALGAGIGVMLGRLLHLTEYRRWQRPGPPPQRASAGANAGAG